MQKQKEKESVRGYVSGCHTNELCARHEAMKTNKHRRSSFLLPLHIAATYWILNLFISKIGTQGLRFFVRLHHPWDLPEGKRHQTIYAHLLIKNKIIKDMETTTRHCLAIGNLLQATIRRFHRHLLHPSNSALWLGSSIMQKGSVLNHPHK